MAKRVRDTRLNSDDSDQVPSQRRVHAQRAKPNRQKQHAAPPPEEDRVWKPAPDRPAAFPSTFFDTNRPKSSSGIPGCKHGIWELVKKRDLGPSKAYKRSARKAAEPQEKDQWTEHMKTQEEIDAWNENMAAMESSDDESTSRPKKLEFRQLGLAVKAVLITQIEEEGQALTKHNVFASSFYPCQVLLDTSVVDCMQLLKDQENVDPTPEMYARAQTGELVDPDEPTVSELRWALLYLYQEGYPTSLLGDHEDKALADQRTQKARQQGQRHTTNPSQFESSRNEPIADTSANTFTNTHTHGASQPHPQVQPNGPLPNPGVVPTLALNERPHRAPGRVWGSSINLITNVGAVWPSRVVNYPKPSSAMPQAPPANQQATASASVSKLAPAKNVDVSEATLKAMATALNGIQTPEAIRAILEKISGSKELAEAIVGQTSSKGDVPNTTSAAPTAITAASVIQAARQKAPEPANAASNSDNLALTQLPEQLDSSNPPLPSSPNFQSGPPTNQTHPATPLPAATDTHERLPGITLYAASPPPSITYLPPFPDPAYLLPPRPSPVHPRSPNLGAYLADQQSQAPEWGIQAEAEDMRKRVERRTSQPDRPDVGVLVEALRQGVKRKAGGDGDERRGYEEEGEEDWNGGVVVKDAGRKRLRMVVEDGEDDEGDEESVKTQRETEGKKKQQQKEMGKKDEGKKDEGKKRRKVVR